MGSVSGWLSGAGGAAFFVLAGSENATDMHKANPKKKLNFFIIISSPFPFIERTDEAYFSHLSGDRSTLFLGVFGSLRGVRGLGAAGSRIGTPRFVGVHRLQQGDPHGPLGTP